jgi:glycosyltransferase involved in cell wall biosynthesis
VGPVKILWVKANKLLPLHSGGDIRSYHIARYLASRHDLRFFSYYDGNSDPDYERRLAEDFPGACCVCTGRPESGPARVLDYISRLGDRAPYAVSRFKSAPVQKRLKEWLAPSGFDVAICDFLDAAVNFPVSHEVPVVLFQHNVESEIWRRHAETEKKSAKRKIYAMECRKMLAYEKAAVQRFPHVIAVSEHDRKLMSAWVDPSRITVVPTGVDLRQYQPDFSERDLQPLVMFVGAMDWEPNIDAGEFFCKEVWPAVLARIPQAKFRIVGRNPDRRVQRFAGDSIEVTGRVPEVIDQLREAAVVIVPLRIGGGTRLKIYEAMAAGKAIVSTSVGAEGLDVHHGRDITLADDPRAFAEAILMLLENADVRKRYEREASELAARYDWPAVAARFEEVLEKVAGHAAMRPAEYVPDRGIGSAATDWPTL